MLLFHECIFSRLSEISTRFPLLPVFPSLNCLLPLVSLSVYFAAASLIRPSWWAVSCGCLPALAVCTGQLSTCCLGPVHPPLGPSSLPSPCLAAASCELDKNLLVHTRSCSGSHGLPGPSYCTMNTIRPESETAWKNKRSQSSCSPTPGHGWADVDPPGLTEAAPVGRTMLPSTADLEHCLWRGAHTSARGWLQ